MYVVQTGAFKCCRICRVYNDDLSVNKFYRPFTSQYLHCSQITSSPPGGIIEKKLPIVHQYRIDPQSIAINNPIKFYALWA